MTQLDKVLAEISRYEHALLNFSAREHRGAIELVIELKNRDLGWFVSTLAGARYRLINSDALSSSGVVIVAARV